MIGFISRILAALGRRALLWGALLLILLSALRIATRQGRHAAEVEFAIWATWPYSCAVSNYPRKWPNGR